MSKHNELNPVTSVALTQNTKEQAIINIIEDSIIYNRICDGMYTILNAQAPQKTCNTLNTGYKGIEIAFILLGVENDDLEDKLQYTYDNYASANQYDMHEVSELARNIYVEWLCDIKRYFLTQKIV